MGLTVLGSQQALSFFIGGENLRPANHCTHLVCASTLCSPLSSYELNFPKSWVHAIQIRSCPPRFLAARTLESQSHLLGSFQYVVNFNYSTNNFVRFGTITVPVIQYGLFKLEFLILFRFLHFGLQRRFALGRGWTMGSHAAPTPKTTRSFRAVGAALPNLFPCFFCGHHSPARFIPSHASCWDSVWCVVWIDACVETWQEISWTVTSLLVTYMRVSCVHTTIYLCIDACRRLHARICERAGACARGWVHECIWV